MSIFSDCTGIGFTAIEDVAGESITYNDGHGDIPDVVAVPDQDEANSATTGGQSRSTSREQVWLIRPKYLVRGGSRFEPKRGHRLTRSDGHVFQVQRAGGEPVWDWSGGQRTAFRIFTVDLGDRS